MQAHVFHVCLQKLGKHQLEVLFHSMNLPGFKNSESDMLFLCPALNCALLVCILSMSAALPLLSLSSTSKMSYITATLRHFAQGVFSSVLCGTFTPIVHRWASCNQSWLFRETRGNCQRPKLSSPTLRVVTVRVCRTKSNRHHFSRVASCSKSSRNLPWLTLISRKSLRSDSRELSCVIICLELCQQLLYLCLLFD